MGVTHAGSLVTRKTFVDRSVNSFGHRLPSLMSIFTLAQFSEYTVVWQDCMSKAELPQLHEVRVGFLENAESNFLYKSIISIHLPVGYYIPTDLHVQ